MSNEVYIIGCILWVQSHFCSFVISTTSISLLCLLSLGSAELAGFEGGGRSVLNVLLRANSDHVTRDSNKLLANSNMSLSDQNSCVMHGVSELSFSNESLESSFHELGKGETQNVIQFSLGLLQKTESDHPSDKGITYSHKYYSILNIAHTLENSLSIFLVQGQKLSGCLSIY